MTGKKRVRNFTAVDRATHRIFEKNRREAFKGRLTELATHLPSLGGTDPQRLSKHVVVEESIARHQLMQQLCLDAFQDIRALVQERDELLAEVNHRRLIDGLTPQTPKTLNLHLDRLVEMEKETGRRDAMTRNANGESSSSMSPNVVTGSMASAPLAPVDMSMEMTAAPDETAILDSFWDVSNHGPIVDALPVPLSGLTTFTAQGPITMDEGMASCSLDIQESGFLDFDSTGNLPPDPAFTYHSSINPQPVEPHPPDALTISTPYLGDMDLSHLEPRTHQHHHQQWPSSGGLCTRCAHASQPI